MPKNNPSRPPSPAERVILDFRKAGFADIRLIGKYHYNHAHRRLAAHSHRKMMEIVYCSKGQQVYQVHDELYRLQGGDLFVTFPGEWHGSGDFPEEKGELYWIIIDLEPARAGHRFLHFGQQSAREWTRQLLQLPRHFKGNVLVRKKLETIFQLFPGRDKPFTTVRLQHAVADCLLEMIACSTRDQGARSNNRLQLLQNYLDTNLDEGIALDKLAALTGLSLSHFKSWFRKETGTTPLDYVLRHKIGKAQELLLDSDESITSIAYETGFQNAQYFATVFRKYTGMTPGRYRSRSADGR